MQQFGIYTPAVIAATRLAKICQIKESGCVRPRLVDISFDDNADDSCTPNYFYDSSNDPLNSLFTASARSWQCGVTLTRAA